MTIEQIWRAIRSHKGLVYLSVLVTVSMAMLIAVVIPKAYTASAAVVVDVKSLDPIVGTFLPQMASPSYMATQVDIVESERVALRVVDKLKLEQDAEMRQQWKDETAEQGSFKAWIAKTLKDNLTVKPSKESNVIEMEYRGASAPMAALIVNAFANAYIDTSLDLKVQPARSYSVFFDERLNAAKDKVRVAQERLSEFQQHNGLVLVTDERLDIENAHLAELSSTLTNIQALGSESQSKSRLTQQQAVLTDELSHPLLNNMRSEASSKEAHVKELSGRLGVNHPEYQRAVEELNVLRNNIKNESGRLSQGLVNADIVNKQREATIRAAIENQKLRILKLKTDRDSAGSLQRDLETAQKQLDQVTLRTTQSDLESRTSQTNISVLNEATEPYKPSAPKLPLIFILSLVTGTLLGCMVALYTEFNDRRIRCADDLQDLHLTALSVLSASTAPKSRSIWSKRPVFLKHIYKGPQS